MIGDVSVYYNPLCLTGYLHMFPHPILFVDPDGKVLAANDPFLEMGSLKQEEVVGKEYGDFIGDARPFSDFIRQIETENECYYLTFPKHSGNEKKKPVQIGLLKLFFQAALQGFALILFDPQEAHLNRVWSLFYQSLYKELNIAFILVDKTLRVVGISDAACRLFGVNREAVTRKFLDDVFPNLPPELQLLHRTVRDGVTFRNHPVTWTIQGKSYDLLVDSYLLRDPKGELEGAYMSLKDVTSLRSLESQLQRKERLITIGQIAAGTAHEIRNPLTSIKGFLQILQQKLDSLGMTREKGYTDVMLKELERINHLVSELLLLGKDKEVHYRPLQVVDVLREILPIIETQAHLHHVEVRLEIKPNLPLVRADSELLKQVLLNISKNGIEAMENGGRLTISQRVDEEAKMLVVSISDTGPGIPAYVMDRIFDPFFTTKENGTGLGLAVCQKIMHDMGGHLTFSTKGYGTTFYIHIPLA
ncbi:MAG: ATP-binding protein [Bacillota bacterium]